jgi:arylsulfatase A-like enzyme
VAAFGLVLLSACGGAGRPATGGVVRLLDGARSQYQGPQPVNREVALPAQAWVAVTAFGQPRDAAGEEALRAQARLTAESLDLAALKGGFVQWIVPDPGQTWRLAGRATELASISLYELKSPPQDPSSDALGELIVQSHAARLGPVAADGYADFRLEFELRPATQVLALCVFGSQAGPSSVAGLQLEQLGFLDQMATYVVPSELDAPEQDDDAEPELAREAGLAPQGLMRVGLDYRRALAIAPGARVQFYAELPGEAPRLRLAWSGATRTTAAAVGLRIEGAADGEEPELLFEAEPEELERAHARWREVTLELPARWARSEVELSFIHGGGELPLLVAEPRLWGGPGSTRVSAVPGAERRVRGPAPAVLLVSLDTLRADHLSCYGYPRPTSPQLDAFAKQAWLFERCWSQAAYTLPSHWSLLTGQFSSVHGVAAEEDVRDPGRSPLLAELLAKQGYETAAFTAGGYVVPEFGFSPGFDRFSIIDPLWNRESSRIARFIEALPDLSRELAEGISVDSLVATLDAAADQPQFLFFHTYAPHEFDPPAADLAALRLPPGPLDEDPLSLAWISGIQTRPPRPIPAAARTRLIELYDAAIHQADRGLGQLLDALEARGLYDQTLIAITSDHGKEIGERGDVDHGGTLYEELVRVPLILRLPGRGFGRSNLPAMGVDIVPTILAALHLPEPRGLQGQDLFYGQSDFPRLPPRAAGRPLYSEIDWVVKRAAWTDGPIKTIYTEPGFGWPDPNAREQENYDLSIDPGELDPLPDDPQRLARLLSFRQGLRELAGQLATTQTGPRRLSVESTRALEALGYVVR